MSVCAMQSLGKTRRVSGIEARDLCVACVCVHVTTEWLAGARRKMEQHT